jgi:hypothetical protein
MLSEDTSGRNEAMALARLANANLFVLGEHREMTGEGERPAI